MVKVILILRKAL